MRAPSLHTIHRSGIVEDDARVREALYTILATVRDIVLEQDISNTEDALAGWMGQCPDVVILNINLPGVSGINCVQKRSDRFPAVQFLVYTTHDDGQRVSDALAAGANGHLGKNAKPMGILTRMRDLTPSGSTPSTPMGRRAGAQLRQTRFASVPLKADLTQREQDILALLAQGLLYKEISLRIGISESAVKQHIHRMYAKLHVQNRTEAVNRYFGR